MEDERIIELFFERSEQAIGELDDKYGKVFHSLSFRILSNHQDAEECVNDAYLATWNAIPPAKPHPLLAFVCKIVRNISLCPICPSPSSSVNTLTLWVTAQEKCRTIWMRSTAILSLSAVVSGSGAIIQLWWTA